MMCSVCEVRWQRDDDEFMPCSPSCLRAWTRWWVHRYNLDSDPKGDCCDRVVQVMLVADHVAEVKRIKGTDDNAIYMDGAEAMRAACIAAVEVTMKANGWDETTIACTVDALREVQP